MVSQWQLLTRSIPNIGLNPTIKTSFSTLIQRNCPPKTELFTTEEFKNAGFALAFETQLFVNDDITIITPLH